MSGAGASMAGRYARTASLVAVAGAVVLSPFGLARGAEWTAWGAAGWFLLALLGVLGGSWLAREYGRPGTGFMKALVAGMLSRLFTAAAGIGLAAWIGGPAPWGWLSGAAAGYLPLQVLEVAWFHRLARREAVDGAGLGVGSERSRDRHQRVVG